MSWHSGPSLGGLTNASVLHFAVISISVGRVPCCGLDRSPEAVTLRSSPLSLSACRRSDTPWSLVKSECDIQPVRQTSKFSNRSDKPESGKWRRFQEPERKDAHWLHHDTLSQCVSHIESWASVRHQQAHGTDGHAGHSGFSLCCWCFHLRCFPIPPSSLNHTALHRSGRTNQCP